MKIDEKLLEKAAKIAVKRGLAQNEQEAEEEIISLDRCRALQDVVTIASLTMIGGNPPSAVLKTLYQAAFLTGVAYQELLGNQSEEPTTENVQPEVKEATAG